jgi:hypothetical protein
MASSHGQGNNDDDQSESQNGERRAQRNAQHSKVEVKVKLSLQQGVEVHRVVRCQGSRIFIENWLTDGGEVVSLMC